jgi:hypothetical protein
VSRSSGSSSSSGSSFSLTTRSRIEVGRKCGHGLESFRLCRVGAGTKPCADTSDRWRACMWPFLRCFHSPAFVLAKKLPAPVHMPMPCYRLMQLLVVLVRVAAAGWLVGLFGWLLGCLVAWLQVRGGRRQPHLLRVRADWLRQDLHDDGDHAAGDGEPFRQRCAALRVLGARRLSSSVVLCWPRRVIHSLVFARARTHAHARSCTVPRTHSLIHSLTYSPTRSVSPAHARPSLYHPPTQSV